MKRKFKISHIVLFMFIGFIGACGFANDQFLKQWQDQTETFVESKDNNLKFGEENLKFCQMLADQQLKKCRGEECVATWEQEKKKCETISWSNDSLTIEDKLPTPIVMPSDSEVSLGISGACISILNIKQFRIIHTCYHLDGSVITTVYSRETTEKLFLDGKAYYDQFLSFYMSAGVYDKTPGILNIDFLDADYAPNCPTWPYYQCVSLDAFRKYLLIFGFKNTVIFHPGQIVFDQYVKGHHTLEQLRKWGAKKIRNLFTGDLCHNSVCLTDQQIKDLVEWGEISEDGDNPPPPVHPGQIVFDQYVKGHHTLEQLRKWGAKKIRDLFKGNDCHQRVCLTDQQVEDLIEWGKISN